MTEGDKLSIGEIKVAEQEQLTLEEIAKLMPTAVKWDKSSNTSGFITGYHGVIESPANLMVHVYRIQLPNKPATFNIDIAGMTSLSSFTNLGSYNGTEDELKQAYETAVREHGKYEKKEEVVGTQTNLRNDILSRVRDSFKEEK